jgi:hypothetical protein
VDPHQAQDLCDPEWRSFLDRRGYLVVPQECVPALQAAGWRQYAGQLAYPTQQEHALALPAELAHLSLGRWFLAAVYTCPQWGWQQEGREFAVLLATTTDAALREAVLAEYDALVAFRVLGKVGA